MLRDLTDNRERAKTKSRNRKKSDRKTVPREINGGAEKAGKHKAPRSPLSMAYQHFEILLSLPPLRFLVNLFLQNCNPHFSLATVLISPLLSHFLCTENEIPSTAMQKAKGKEIINKIQEKVGLGSSTSSPETGEGKSKIAKKVTHGYHCVKGKTSHPMEDYAFAQFKEVDSNELGLFAIFDGHLSREIPDYLKSHLFDNILNQPDFWTDTESAVRKSYHDTDAYVLHKFGRGGSTAVTAILINCQRLVVANVGDSRAVVCRNGKATQLSVDHEPNKEEEDIESRGGFVTRDPGDVPRVDGELAVARAFGDKSIKEHLSSDPHVMSVVLDDDTDSVLLASDGIWHVMSNQEAADCIKAEKDAKSASKKLIEFALSRHSSDDISVVVVNLK